MGGVKNEFFTPPFAGNVPTSRKLFKEKNNHVFRAKNLCEKSSCSQTSKARLADFSLRRYVFEVY